MIKNVIFDLGGVLINGKRTLEPGDLDISEEERIEINEKFFGELAKLDYEDGTIEECYRKSGLTLNENLKNYLVHYYEHKTYNKALINLKNQLSEHYDVYILSNMNREAIEYLKKIHIFDNTKGYVVSQDCGITKPNTKIYRVLCDKYNLKPDECLFIDDKRKNVNAATNMGMRGFVYEENNDELVNYMKSLNMMVDYV